MRDLPYIYEILQGRNKLDELVEKEAIAAGCIE